MSEKVDKRTNVGVQVSSQLLLRGRGVVIYHLNSSRTSDDRHSSSIVEPLIRDPLR